MRRLESRERLLLGVFALVLLVQGFRMLSPLSGGAPLGAAGSGPSSARGAAKALVVADARTLDLEALAGRSGEIEVGRDPFRFVVPRPPPPPPPQPAPPPIQAPPPPPSGPRPPDVDLSYLGSFGQSQRRIAVFSDGRTIYNAMHGETLAGKFVVHAIGYESVDLTFVGFPDVPPQRLAVGG
ncbi:MAG TPA: hypothetical protein VMS86_00450 [Thermoanaerobaculia bacterium]|nr:hypothetical protein [Thermoanaerobaculia bacterium]